MARTDRPNFLFIITDQQRADHLGCYGHPVLRTPAIDAIAAAGTRFQNFYVANPMCMPNRSTLMTGRMSSLHGVRHNGISLSRAASTFVDALRLTGYRTALIGKSHLQSVSSAPPEKGADPAADAPLRDAVRRAPGRYDQEQPRPWASGEPPAMQLPFYGFEHVDLVTGHGDACGGHYRHWLHQQCPTADRLYGPDNQLPHAYRLPQAWRTALPEALHPTRYIRDRACDWLRDRAGDTAPFFAFVSFPDPHHPFTPPGRYWGMHSPADMRLPASFDAHRNPPPHLQWCRDQRRDGNARTGGPTAFAVDAQEAREAMALTCDMIAMIDDAVGGLLDTLRGLELERDTVVVFTSDHGDFLGDHGLLLKGPMHFQGVLRVPFIWSDPAAEAPVSVASGLAGTLDIARTILARAGIPPYNGMQGIDLGPALASGETGRHAVLVEDESSRTYLGFDSPPRLRTLVTASHRLSVYQGVPWGELYALDDDPHETFNLWHEPGAQSLKAELVLELADAMMAAAETSPWPERIA